MTVLTLSFKTTNDSPSVGEPINPEAWLWYHKYVGGEKCSIVDTYWQVRVQYCARLHFAPAHILVVVCSRAYYSL